MNKHGRIIIISNVSGSLINFRGELIKTWIDIGYEVYAFAPQFKSNHKSVLKTMNANPIEYKL
ncbi:MAG: glycosyltransferase family 1 protein, partial [archaeon]